MNAHLIETAQRCLNGAESNDLTFPEIVETLVRAGFESYTMDFRRATATYYLPDGDSVVLASHGAAAPIAGALNIPAIQSAIREAQRLAPGYTYEGFRSKVMEAGCAGYIASFSGRRVVYFGRTAETHTEHFPGTRQAKQP
jgi:uncharacterized protein YbcV (DUF1398 family)